MEKLYLFLVLALLGNEVVCQDGQSGFFVPQSPTVTSVRSRQFPVTTPYLSTSASSVEDCIRSCPVTPEYNPVCGVIYVTYDNPGRLGCAQACGVPVSIFRASRCPPPPPPQS